MKETNVSALKDIVSQLIGRSPFKQQMAAANLRIVWKKIMPISVCSRTDSLFIKTNKVFVKISSAPLRQELQASKIKVLHLLQKEVTSYKINDVIFL